MSPFRAFTDGPAPVKLNPLLKVLITGWLLSGSLLVASLCLWPFLTPRGLAGLPWLGAAFVVFLAAHFVWRRHRPRALDRIDTTAAPLRPMTPGIALVLLVAAAVLFGGLCLITGLAGAAERDRLPFAASSAPWEDWRDVAARYPELAGPPALAEAEDLALLAAGALKALALPYWPDDPRPAVDDWRPEPVPGFGFDCEDRVLWLIRWAALRGVPAGALHVAIVRLPRPYRGARQHAVLVVEAADGDLVANLNPLPMGPPAGELRPWRDFAAAGFTFLLVTAAPGVVKVLAR